MTLKQEKVFCKYTEDLKKYLIISFVLITVLLAAGGSLAVLLHGFQTVYIVFPLMWVLVLFGYLAKIPFLIKAHNDFYQKQTANEKITAPCLTFDTKNCLKVQKGAIIGNPKYTVKDNIGKTYYLYISAIGTDVKDKISFEDGVFEIEYLKNTGIILSIKPLFHGDADDHEDFEYKIFKFLGDYAC